MAAPATTGQDYFDSYCDLGVHELMLQDRPRTTFYRRFFEVHRDLVKGKVVMDVGAGTGILSLFAATAGAKKVYAVEASQVASLCEEIVKDNEFETVIEVIHGAVEDISLPGDIRVDVIVSEWMGFYLLHESMLESVLVARDRFLAPGGILVPSVASLFLAPVDMSEHFQDRADYWNNIYGYDFSPIASTINIQEVSKPLIKTLPPSSVKAKASKILDLDLMTTCVEDFNSFSKTCKFSMSEESRIHGFVAWFDVGFEAPPGVGVGDKCCEDITTNSRSNDSNKDDKCGIHQSAIGPKGDSDIKDSENCALNLSSDNNGKRQIRVQDSEQTKWSSCLSTSPSSPATHWKQTVVFLPQTIMVMEDILLCCRVKMTQDSENKRHYKISLEMKDEMDVDEDSCSDEADSDDSCDHPVPCECGSNRCRLISALVEKYDVEHQELVEEAEMVETEAEVEAAKEIDVAIETEGWSLDTSGTDGQDKAGK